MSGEAMFYKCVKESVETEIMELFEQNNGAQAAQKNIYRHVEKEIGRHWLS